MIVPLKACLACLMTACPMVGGGLLLDRKLMNAGLNPGILSPLDRLCFIGTSGMETLSYDPENAQLDPKDISAIEYAYHLMVW